KGVLACAASEQFLSVHLPHRVLPDKHGQLPSTDAQRPMLQPSGIETMGPPIYSGIVVPALRPFASVLRLRGACRHWPDLVLRGKWREEFRAGWAGSRCSSHRPLSSMLVFRCFSTLQALWFLAAPARFQPTIDQMASGSCRLRLHASTGR